MCALAGVQGSSLTDEQLAAKRAAAGAASGRHIQCWQPLLRRARRVQRERCVLQAPGLSERAFLSRACPEACTGAPRSLVWPLWGPLPAPEQPRRAAALPRATPSNLHTYVRVTSAEQNLQSSCRLSQQASPSVPQGLIPLEERSGLEAATQVVELLYLVPYGAC